MKVALLGLGVVGSGVYHQITTQQKILEDMGIKIELCYGLCKEVTSDLKERFTQLHLVDDVNTILNDPTIDLVIEVMGGVDFPYQVIKEALIKKKNVVSANKDLMAVHAHVLLSLAQKNNVDLYFEGGVAGGIPVLQTLNNGLLSDNIYDIKGIFNGTCNYILTKMAQDNLSYETALKQAKELGFAESDPTSDVEGIDAARKVAIVAYLAYHIDAKLDDVVVQGITSVTSEDISLAKSLNHTIKLIGQTTYHNEQVTLNVSPTFVENTNLLAQINDEINAVLISGEFIKQLLLVGPGAGSNPTAVAVVSDILKVETNLKTKANGLNVNLAYKPKQVNNNELIEKYIVIGEPQSITNLSQELKVEANKNYLIYECTYNQLQTIIKDYNFKVYPII